jgi:hypothetical protein
VIFVVFWWFLGGWGGGCGGGGTRRGLLVFCGVRGGFGGFWGGLGGFGGFGGVWKRAKTRIPRKKVDFARFLPYLLGRNLQH